MIHDTILPTDTGPFRVYRNLNKSCWSVQHRPGYGIQGWRVLAHMNSLLCTDVTFKVSEAGRQRVLSSGRKNVHAYVCTSHLSFQSPDWSSSPPLDGWEEITYDPRKHEGFVTLKNEQLVQGAQAVLLSTYGRAFAHNIDY